MSTILVKILATALTLGQVTTRPEAIRTSFDPARDQPAVAQVLKDGCAHMRKAFDIEDINLDELISTAMEDPSAVAGAGAPKLLHGLDIDPGASHPWLWRGDYMVRRQRSVHLQVGLLAVNVLLPFARRDWFEASAAAGVVGTVVELVSGIGDDGPSARIVHGQRSAAANT